MKTSDIVVGAEYAHADNYQWNPTGRFSSRSQRTATKVTVLAVSQPREAWHSQGLATWTTQVGDGIKVRAEDGREFITIPSKVRQTWEDFLVAQAEAARQKQERDLHVNALAARQKAIDTLVRGALRGVVPEDWFKYMSEETAAAVREGTDLLVPQVTLEECNEAFSYLKAPTPERAEP